MNRLDLIKALNFCLSAAGVKDVRYYLNGVLLEFRNDETRLVGTDGHRLATITVPSSGASPVGHDLILPRYYAENLVKRLALSNSETVCFIPGTGHTWHDSEGGEFAAVDARFPDWRRIEPRNFSPTACLGLNANYVADAVKAFKPLQPKGEKYPVLRFDFEGDNLGVRITSPAHENAYIKIMPVRL